MEHDFDDYQSSLLYVKSPTHTWDYESIFIGFNRKMNEHKMIFRYWEYSNFIESAKIEVYKPAFVRIREKKTLLKPQEIVDIKKLVKTLNDEIESNKIINLDCMNYLLSISNNNHQRAYKWNDLKLESNTIIHLLDYLNKIKNE